jgi:hypothetical protein
MEAINEIKILSDVRLVSRSNFTNNSNNNLHVQFNLSGELRGTITCYLCLDKHELNPTEKNYIFPLFVEAMNILVGKQVSQDKKLKGLKVMLSPPKLSMISQNLKSEMQHYELELNSHTFSILTDYNLEALS